MCRATTDKNGGRRCPYHSNPKVMALASAKQAADRMFSRIEAAQDNLTDEQYDRRIQKLMASYERVQERAQACPQALPPAPTPADGSPRPERLPDPAPTLADTLNTESVKDLSWSEMAEIAEVVKDDPEAAAKLETLIDEKEAYEIEQAKKSEDEATRRQAEADEKMRELWASAPVKEPINDTTTNPAARSERKLTPHERAREEYDEYLYSQYSKCTSELSFMLNEEGRAKGIDDFSLFSGNAARVKKYGSEELQAWFGTNGRHTLGSFRYGMFRWGSDHKAAMNAKNEGFENVAHVY